MMHALFGHGALAVALSSGLALSLLGARIAYTDSILFVFLVWNLILALIPWGLSRTVLSFSMPEAWPLRGVLLAVWLLFLPNAPYLATDLVHLRPRSEVPFWFDVAMMVSFAGAGFVICATSLQHVHRSLPRWLGWPVVTMCSGLVGVGIYLGRFLRWNSWDALLRPTDVVVDLLSQDPIQAGGVAVAWGVLTWTAFAVFQVRSMPGSA